MVKANQHVVSAVLLRLWKEPFGVTNLDSGVTWLRSAKSEGYVRNFVGDEYSERIEKVWEATENQLNKVFAQVENGTVFENGQALDVLRSMIAMHHVRSLRTGQLHAGWLASQSAKGGRLAGLRSMADNSVYLHERYMQRTDQVAPTSFHIEQERAVYLGSLEAEFGAGGNSFAEQLVVQYENTFRFLGHHPIQIGVAVEGEFLIGDTPVVTLDSATGEMGVPIAQADTIVMPLGPKYVLAVGRSADFVDLNNKAVTHLNRLQVASARSKVYTLAGRDLGSWAVTVRHAITPDGHAGA
jgi:Protein of unknown function (DUF4238)